MSHFSKSARHTAQLAAVLPYTDMNDLSADVLDRIAGLRKDLPVVFVLYYGGTIGMMPVKEAFDRKVYGPTDNPDDLLKPLYIKGLQRRVQVVWVPVYPKPIDSTNGRWVHWVSIGNIIRLLYDQANGFVVCGGTDTMAHMLAAMRFMFPNIGKPIVGTGSQLPIMELGDDGTNNLFFAISAAGSDLSGSFLMFGDKLRDGARVHKIRDKARQAFTSPDPYLFGRFDDQLRIYPNAPRRNPIVTGARLIYRPNFREGVKVVRLSPATPSESLLHDAIDPTCSAALLITYGAGNVRDEGVVETEKTHIDCLWELYQRRYPVVLGSPMIDGVVESPYLSGERAVAREEGGGNAISGGSVTGPLLEVKCMAALAYAWDEETGELDYDRFREFMENDSTLDTV